jgi:putative ATP-dependent endonuclease of the OLD family
MMPAQVSTGDSLVLVGENKVGKSNFIRALQLILDPGLSERDRQLTLDQFWDGLGIQKLGSIQAAGHAGRSRVDT